MDKSTFQQKLQQYKDMVYRIAYTYLRNTADAEDVSQETFLKFYQLSKPFTDAGLEKAVRSDCTTVFFLYGTILDIASHVERVKQAGKIVFVHADLIEGLTARDITADFIAQNTQADGIISTRPNIIRRAKALGLLTIQRFFLFDSLSFENVLRQSSNADAVDLLPGTMPRVLERLKPQIRQPIIASGLLSDKQDVVAALSAGAQAVSTTKPELWEI